MAKELKKIDRFCEKCLTVKSQVRWLGTKCSQCRIKERKKRWRESESGRKSHNKSSRESHARSFLKKMFREAKRRAIRKGLQFDITFEYLKSIYPDSPVCPVLAIPIIKPIAKEKHGASPNSPSIDRIVPSLGYIVGNIRIISWRANSLKKDITLEEAEAIYKDMLNIKNHNGQIPQG